MASSAADTAEAAGSPVWDRTSHELNRESWNEATKAHNAHKRDQAGFLRRGGTTLFAEERDLLFAAHPPAAPAAGSDDLDEGSDGRLPLAGQRLLHLQCNSGQDTLSIVSEGRPAHITGVDISDEAVAFARQLSAESGLPADFVRSDVLDFLLHTQAPAAFDTVFASYGTICWLSNLKLWAQGIARVLRPGGALVVVEFHPVLTMFEDDPDTRSQSYFPKSSAPHIYDDGVGDYVAMSGEALAPMGYEAGDGEFENTKPAAEFFWPLSTIVQSVLDAGLVLERLDEYPHCNGCRFYPQMVPRSADEPNIFVMPGDKHMPMMYSLVARKPK